MNPNTTPVLVSEHIREARQQAAAARLAAAARKPGTHSARRGLHWLARTA
jgi:hypothetical protein